MSKKQLFKKVHCKSYLIKKDNIPLIINTDNHIGTNNFIFLDDGNSIEIDFYEKKEHNFYGYIVGIFNKIVARKFIDNAEDGIYIEPSKIIKVAKVYYANNKSKLVPIEDILEEEN